MFAWDLEEQLLVPFSTACLKYALCSTKHEHPSSKFARSLMLPMVSGGLTPEHERLWVPLLVARYQQDKQGRHEILS